MGTWNLERITSLTEPLNGETFGTNFHVHFRLRYKPSRIGRFVETPRLEWQEKILVKEHHQGKWWEFETNMYQHNPTSQTLKIWARRYIEAYNDVMNQPYVHKGESKLLNRHGQPVRVPDLRQGLTDPQDKANAVRSYLQRNGGILNIEIHDVPAISTPKNGEHKERLLVFNCGIAGSRMKLSAEQFIEVNAAVPQHQWQREFNVGQTRAWQAGTLEKVAPPPVVSTPREALFTRGECW